jgi:hypothetical protein
MSSAADQFALLGRAFRIQFRAEADIERGICCGRIEHVRSGDAAHFATVQELLAFVQFCMTRRNGAGATTKGQEATEAIAE